MKNIFIIGLNIFLILVAGSAIAEEFMVGVGDRLVITVYEHDDLSMNVRISGDGTIKVPFLGHIKVVDMTTREIANKLTTEFVSQEYLVNPQIIVFIDEYKSRKANILGQVKQPGRYELDEDTTIMVLITIASGFTARASKKNARIIRKINGKNVILEKVTLDERVIPGDIVIIPESFF